MFILLLRGLKLITVLNLWSSSCYYCLCIFLVDCPSRIRTCSVVDSACGYRGTVSTPTPIASLFFSLSTSCLSLSFLFFLPSSQDAKEQRHEQRPPPVTSSATCAAARSVAACSSLVLLISLYLFIMLSLILFLVLSCSLLFAFVISIVLSLVLSMP